MVDVRRGMFGVNGSGDTSGYGRLVREVALPGSSPRPYGGYFDEVVDRLAEALQRDGVEFEDAIEKVVVYRDELTLHIRRELLQQVAQRLRDDAGIALRAVPGRQRGALPARDRPGTARRATR